MGLRSSSLDDVRNGDESNLESAKVRTIRFGSDECEMQVSFDQSVVESDSPENLAKEDIISIEFHDSDKCESFMAKPSDTACKEMGREDEAAVKLQKVYKSFRTRRKLADCAVLVEEGWWKVMDFVELERSSLLFFDKDRQESAVSRWSRAKTKAAKVGKGLSKNSKARKLALQHWLEAIDPRHRYGHNLHFYYIKWLETQSKQPFFYWLDIGEGKRVNLEKSPRSKLQQQCVQYLGPLERQAYEVVLEDGKFRYKQTGEVIHTVGEKSKAKWIFVLSTSKVLYVGKKKKGRFQHSSFLAGGVTIAAGRLVVENGVLKAVWPHSGHYQPTEENFQDFIAFLRENNVDLTDVKTSSAEEDEQDAIRGRHRRIGSLDMEGFDEETHEAEQESERHSTEQTKNCIKGNWQKPFTTSVEELLEKEVIVSRDSILGRMSSRRETGSYQLGKWLSCRWTTGAGPRIGCVRDYPPEMQCRVLEQLNLSPRRTLTSSARKCD
ncbi:PREDICTED: IQ domain-containing protein IQM2-like [Tarenaya hassleriana]|uniref:IQ domain-containing protein IQM2-like n=1 Tax=Tarenaya hassleriana TaxID=28532 RepID=UPI00053C2C8A|nr:PREDICTED: IQ domain-containing protein IQM2-like [Tarenaya hassleriana]XP_010519657.1 PREDICTED: IQ domain-containing protein IQM2-like [Tarenaya hassleriana]